MASEAVAREAQEARLNRGESTFEAGGILGGGSLTTSSNGGPSREGPTAANGAAHWAHQDHLPPNVLHVSEENMEFHFAAPTPTQPVDLVELLSTNSAVPWRVERQGVFCWLALQA